MPRNYLIKSLWVVVILVIIVVAGLWLLKQKVGPIVVPPDQTATSTDDVVENLGLTVPAGFKINVFASGVAGARAIELDPQGRLVVSQTGEDKISVVADTDGDGVADTVKTLVADLDKPHGLAFDCPIDDRQLPCLLYVAQHGEVGRYLYRASDATVSSYLKIADIEAAATDRHFTRSLLFLPSPDENLLLISVGSSCDVCREEEKMRGKIMVYNTKDGTLTEYAKGLRNSVFMALNPVSGKVFATEMGRDGLGDDIPPDEINIIEPAKSYGWPICYGQNIHDGEFDKNTYIRNPCMLPFEIPAFVDLPAHSAPLGLAFVPEEGWPEDYWYDILVAFHGSWNRSVPTGYKIVRLKFDAAGKYSGTEDFITGWLDSAGKKSGRPVDIKVLSGGTAYISDDASGVIYKLSRE